MRYLTDIRAAAADPERLEALYRLARKERAVPEFTADLVSCHDEAPSNLLFAAWFYRLQPAAGEANARTGAHWPAAIVFAALAGIVLALLVPDLQGMRSMPPFTLYIGPIVAAAIMAYLAVSAGRGWQRAVLIALGLGALAVYGNWLAPFNAYQPIQQVQLLLYIHLPLAAAIGVGVAVLGLRPDRQNLWAVLVKAIEVMVTAGVFLIVAMMFGGIAMGMFAALKVEIPMVLVERAFLLAVGAIPVLAVASVYDPHLQPVEQKFEQGLGKLIPILTRILLPLAVVLLAVYIVLIPSHFMEPFTNRDQLIVYNAMLFGVMALLLGVAPASDDDLSPRLRSLLRTGMIVLSALALVISVYAISATLYRTINGGLTVNRLTVLGWNTVNIGVLALLLVQQVRGGARNWVRSLQSTAYLGIIGYVVWTAFVLLAIPALF